jgi:hypothetical protein
MQTLSHRQRLQVLQKEMLKTNHVRGDGHIAFKEAYLKFEEMTLPQVDLWQRISTHVKPVPMHRRASTRSLLVSIISCGAYTWLSLFHDNGENDI